MLDDPVLATSVAGGSRPHVPLPRVRTTWLFGLAALVVAGAIAAALFGLPVRTWFDQDSELQALDYELTEMQSVNHDLQGEVDRLQTDDGIREAAREELGHVETGDNRQTILELPPLPTDLPDGWPYSQVEAILAVRAAVTVPSTSGVDAPTMVAPSTTGIPPTTASGVPTTAGAAPTTTAVGSTTTSVAATSTTAAP